MMGARAFAKWGIDFVGPIHPAMMHTHAEYMIVAAFYVTKRFEAEATIKNDARMIAKSDWEMKLHSILWAYQVAYKMAIGTMPSNMVFGLNAILPMEFSIPTLHAAQQLERIGHELSEHIDELEKLDEMHLKAVVGRYVCIKEEAKVVP